MNLWGKQRLNFTNLSEDSILLLQRFLVGQERHNYQLVTPCHQGFTVASTLYANPSTPPPRNYRGPQWEEDKIQKEHLCSGSTSNSFVHQRIQLTFSSASVESLGKGFCISTELAPLTG